MRPILILATTELELLIGRNISIKYIRQIKQLNGLILWDCEGMWGLVSANQIAELVRQWDEFLKAKKQYPRTKSATIKLQFQSTIPVSSNVARAIRLKG